MDNRSIKIIGIIAAVLSIISAILFILDWKKKKDIEAVSAGGSAGAAGAAGGGKPKSNINADTPLVLGMQGATIEELQSVLNARGQKYQGAALTVDGDFGNKTKTVSENYLASRLQPISPITLNRIKALAV